MGCSRISIEEVNNLITEKLEQIGVPEVDALLVADTLLDAEIRGVTSHGLMRLPSYQQRLELRLIEPNPQISIKTEGNVLRVDGGNGLGQVVTRTALDAAMQLAHKKGSAIALVKNSNHFGTAGYYSRIAANRGFGAFVATNASPVMPPFGGLDNMLGTNPFAYSFPAGKYRDFTLDIAMSAVAKGKVRMYAKEGKPIPQGWAMTSDGKDTTDANEAINGVLLPMGGHKGYGLAMVVDFLCGMLTGAKLSCETESLFGSGQVAGIGHFIAVVDIGKISNLDEFKLRTETWLDAMKASRKREGTNEIYIPGEIENLKFTSANGVVEVLDDTLRAIGYEV